MSLVLVVDDNRDIAEALANVIELVLKCDAVIAYAARRLCGWRAGGTST